MDASELIVAQAASGLTVRDFEWLCAHGILPGPAEDRCAELAHPEAASRPETPSPPEAHCQESGNQKKRRTRRTRKHLWPDVGTLLSADYHGEHYEAEVVEAPRYKSGRAVKVLTGPAAGKAFSSMSGAMLAATEAQRQEQNLGCRGVSNGWRFWKVQSGGDT